LKILKEQQEKKIWLPHTTDQHVTMAPTHAQQEAHTQSKNNGSRTRIFTVGCLLAPASLAALTRLEHSICESNSPMRKQQYTAPVRA
jgi:hypothetical protein